MVQVYEQRTAAQGGASATPLMNTPQVPVGAMGQAQQNLGTSITNTATLAADIHNKNAQESAALWSANAVSQARLDWTKKINEMQDQSTGDGAGFSQKVLTDFKEYEGKLAQSAPDAQTRNMLKQHMSQLGTQLGTQAIEYQNQQRMSYNVDQFKSTLNNNVATVSIDPTQAAPVYANTLQSIDKMQIPFDKKLQLKDAAREQMVSAYVDNQVRTNPAGFKNALAPSVGQLPEGTPQAKIATAAKSAGNNPIVSLAIGQIESGIDATAESGVPGSTAKGIYQFTDATWKQFGGTDANRNDPQAQIEIQQKLQTYNANYLRAHLGREPKPTEEYMAHFLGAGGATAVLQADPNMSMADAVKQYDPKHADQIIQGNNLEGKTVGQVLQSYDKKMNSAMNKFASKEQQAAAPFIQNIMTPAERDHAIHMATQAEREHQQAQVVNMKQTLEDQTAMAMNGVTPKQLLTQDQFNMMYNGNPDQAKIQYQNYVDTIDTGLKINQMSNMTTEQRSAMINTVKPDPTQPGYADKMKLKQQMITANAQIQKQLEDDPVNFINNKSIAAKNALQTLQASNTPENRQAYYSTIIAAQQQQGIMSPKLLTQSQEDQTIQQLSHTQGLDRVKALQQLSQQYGAHWGTVANQIASNKNAPDGMAAILQASDQRYAEQAALVSGQDINKLSANLASGDKGTIDAAIQSAMQPYIQSIGVGQQGSKQVEDLTNNLKKQAYAQVAMGRSPSDVVSNITDGFVGEKKYNYVENENRTFRIPVKYNQDTVKDNANNIVEKLSINDIDLAATQPLTNPYDLTPNVDGLLGMIKDKAVWQTDKSDTSATLYFIGKDNLQHVVLAKNGKPITKNLAELNANSEPKYVPQENKAAENESALLSETLKVFK
jgi:uncharacterized protein YidB (DUF937 family)